MDKSGFSEILEKSRALRTKQEALASGFSDNIPRLERALSQIDRESRRLAAGHVSNTNWALPGVDVRHDDAKAQRLLAEHGFQTDNIERNLESIRLYDAFESYKSVADTDLDTHLGRMHEKAVVSAIEAALEHAKRVSMTSMSSTIEAEWEASKRELVSLSGMQYRMQGRKTLTPKTLATAPGGAFASPFRFPRGTQAKRYSFAAGDSRRASMRVAESGGSSIYEGVVRKAVHARAKPGVGVSVATELDDALVARLAPRGDILNAPRSVQQLHAVFNAMRYIVGEANEATPPSEGAFGGMYGAEERRNACMGAYQFLCLQFREDKMKRDIELRPVEARRGGVPGMKADVRAYLNLVFDRGVPEQLQKGTMYDGMPIWAQLFYCMRAGSMSSALEILDDSIRNGVTDSSLELAQKCLRATLDSKDMRTLPHSLLQQLVQDYGLEAKREDDPYKRVCYVVLSRLDPAAGDKMSLPDGDYSVLFYSIEDYLWLRLSVVRLDGDEKAPNSLANYQLSLKSIQDEVKSFGPAHFDPQGDTPAFYALVLLLTCQFAEAITYLDCTARAIAEATHVAYTLYYYGIIREIGGPAVSGSSGTQDDCFQINYADLLWRYVSRFSRADPTAAAVYLFTLRDWDIRNDLLQRLLLETKAFDLLVGSKSSEIGDRDFGHVGVLQELWPLGGRNAGSDKNWLSVVEAAASAAEESGDRSSAVILYDVAGVRGRVVYILVDRLCAELISKDSTVRADVFREAQEYRLKIAGNKYRLGRERTDYMLEQLMPSFDMLLSMGEFFDLLWDQKFDKAWVLMDGLSFLPSTDGQLVNKTSELRVGGGVWAESLCGRLPEIVLGAMECLAALYSQLRQEGRVEGGRGLLTMTSVRSAGRTLLNFSGMLENLSADISARLVRLDVLMS